MVGEERVVAGPGTFVNMLIGQPHAFKNESTRTARMLISLMPAGLEEYFFEVGQPIEGEQPPKPTEAEIARLVKAAPKYGIEFIRDWKQLSDVALGSMNSTFADSALADSDEMRTRLSGWFPPGPEHSD